MTVTCHDDFADAVLHAVDLGDDTATTGDVAGGLAGILHGKGAIPAEWLEGLVKRGELVALAERIAGVLDSPDNLQQVRPLRLRPRLLNCETCFFTPMHQP